MAVVDKRGFVISLSDLSKEKSREIVSALYVKPIVNPDYAFKPVEEYAVFSRDLDNLYLPRFYGDTLDIKHDVRFDDLEKKNRLNSIINLRDYQTTVVEAACRALDTRGGGILACGTGTGKTSMALYIACHYRVKTLVLVHKSFLLQQWKTRIEEFVPGAKIGHIQGPVCDVENKDIVLCMLQSVATKEYAPQIFQDFGLVIADECHHLSAEVFCRALPKVASKYMLGLSATPTRKDGLTKVFKWYLGDIAYTYVRTDTDSVLAKRVLFTSPEPHYGKEKRNFRKNIALPQMINDIAATTDRNEVIVSEVAQYVLEDRQVMVISDRLAHLDILKDLVDSKNIVKEGKLIRTGFYTGRQKQKELVQNESCDVIFSSYGLVREGLDIQSLNTIILATPISDVVQVCGRIMRKAHSCNPLVIDFVDSYSIFFSQAKKRLGFYQKSGYNIFDVTYDIKQKKVDLQLSTVDMQKQIADREICVEIGDVEDRDEEEVDVLREDKSAERPAYLSDSSSD